MRWWLGLVVVAVGCGPGVEDSGASGSGGSSEGGVDEGGASQSGSGDGDGDGDSTGEDDDPPVECSTLSTVLELGDVHRAGASPSECLFGHQVIGPETGDSLRIAWLAAGEIEVVTDSLTRTLPYSWSFMTGDSVVFREVNDLFGPLRRWDSETSEVETLADAAGDFLVARDRSAVFWLDGDTDPPMLYVQAAGDGAPVALTEAVRLDDVYALADGTQGILFDTPEGALAWADTDEEVNVLAGGVTLGGVDPVSGRAMVMDDADLSGHLIALRGDAPDLPLDIVAPEEPGDITPNARFSPDGTRMIAYWDVFDFDFGYIADRTDLVTLDGDTASAEVSACEGWALPSVHDAGVLCWRDFNSPAGRIELLPHDGGTAQTLVEFVDWERRIDGSAALASPLRGGQIDGKDPELINILDVSGAVPTTMELGPGFIFRFALSHPSADPEWLTYSERPFLGLSQADYDPRWHVYHVDTGEALELPGIPVGQLPRYIVGNAVAYVGSDDIVTLAPRAP